MHLHYGLTEYLKEKRQLENRRPAVIQQKGHHYNSGKHTDNVDNTLYCYFYIDKYMHCFDKVYVTRFVV